MICGFQAFGIMPPCVLAQGHEDDHEDGIGGHYSDPGGAELVQVEGSKEMRYVSAPVHVPGSYLSKLRACSVCTEYAEQSTMINKADGRVICPSCDKRIERQTAKKAQINLFGQQSLI